MFYGYSLRTNRVSSSDFSRYARTRSSLTSAVCRALLWCFSRRPVHVSFGAVSGFLVRGRYSPPDEEIPYPTGGTDRTIDTVGIPNGWTRITEKTAYRTAIGFRTAITSFRRRTSATDFPRTCVSGRVLLTRSAGVARARKRAPVGTEFRVVYAGRFLRFYPPAPPPSWPYAMFVANFG